ncbi:B12-binding domain-containing protein [Methanoregula sp.]|uniref:cobalamin B12-binding domain-containing protein n=1 Tax=Methanoregula sp. TaxID=2052170 RepID=UPI003563EF72
MTQAASQVYYPVNLNRDAIALKLYDRYWQKYPEVYRNFSALQKTQMLEDFKTHLEYLQESLAIGDSAIFINYAGWAKVMYSSLHRPEDCLPSGLGVMREVLRTELSPEMSKKTEDYIAKSISSLATAPTEVPTFIRDDNPLAAVARKYLEALLAADRNTALAIISDQVKKGVTVREIYLNVFQPVLYEVGRLWQIRKTSVTQEHYVTGATQLIIAQLYQQLMAENRNKRRRGKTLVAACVSDELHEMGVRMVADFFEMDGWDTYYIGANTPAPDLIAAIKEREADVVALSSTMVSHLPRIDYLIRSLRGDPDTRQVKIIIGGYPFNIVPALWQKIGADAYAASADEAVRAGNRLSPAKE